MPAHEQRRLTTIVAADVAGYGRLTGADEEGTMRRLRALRAELIDRRSKPNAAASLKLLATAS
jgi:class 3 adenylate cyclase